MKQFFHKTMSLTMAFIVLFSTLSFTINMHYCGETLVETAVFQKAKGCGMEMNRPSAEGCAITKKNCCDNKQLAIEGQDELQLSAEKIEFQHQVFLTSLVYAYVSLFEGFQEDIVPLNDYSPPLVQRDIQVLYEVFLI